MEEQVENLCNKTILFIKKNTVTDYRTSTILRYLKILKKIFFSFNSKQIKIDNKDFNLKNFYISKSTFFTSKKHDLENMINLFVKISNLNFTCNINNDDIILIKILSDIIDDLIENLIYLSSSQKYKCN